MQGFRRKRPEVPYRIRIFEVSLRVALLCMNKIRELDGIAYEEYRRIVANKIIVAFIRIELDSEATRVAHRIG
ncbi:hypothetical protein D3C80_2195090 [compost metagenome]